MNTKDALKPALFLLAGLMVLSCSKVKRKADKAFFKEGAFEDAANLYQEALSKGGDSRYLNGQIAESYRKSNRLSKAEGFYKSAIDAGYKADSIQFWYGTALKASGKYTEAMEQFQKYANDGGNPDLQARATREVSNLQEIQNVLAKPVKYELTPLEGLNTADADYGPFLFKRELYFASNRNSNMRFAGTGTGFSDLYKYKFEGVSIANGTVAALNGVNTSAAHEASATFNKDGKIMVFARSNDGSRKGAQNVDLYVARKKGKTAEYGVPELLGISHPTAWDGCPAFSPDGKSLYFSSNRPGGQGGSDIYRANVEGGRISKVTNLGPDINTPGDELFPYVSDEGKLYFSSDGHPGLGNLDIFEAIRGKDKKVTIQNMGVPINSVADDFGICFRSPADGYFTSNREGGKGDDDIYYFVDPKSIKRTINFVLNGTAMEKDATGNLVALPNTKVSLLDAEGNVLKVVKADKDAKFTFKLDGAKNYEFIGEKADYYTKHDNFTTSGKGPDPSEMKEVEATVNFDYNLVLDKVQVNQTFVLENILYDFNSAKITEQAAGELDKLVDFMLDNPSLSIELSSHTDSRGSAEYNNKLSQSRADSAVAYITSRGINRARIAAKGYGMDKPIIENAVTEEDFQKNRRTEIKITSYDRTKAQELENKPIVDPSEEEEEEEVEEAPAKPTTPPAEGSQPKQEEPKQPENGQEPPKAPEQK